MNEPTVKKEELRKKYLDWYYDEYGNPNFDRLPEDIFNFFYSEIEAREKSITILAKEMKNQEELIKAADEVIDRYTKEHGDIEGVHRKAALEHYQTLKSNPTSTQGD